MTLYEMCMYHRSVEWQIIKNSTTKNRRKILRKKAKHLEGIIKEKMCMALLKGEPVIIPRGYEQ